MTAQHNESQKNASEVVRLEQLWNGQFGNDYVDRNANTTGYRETYWRDLLAELKLTRVLEVGCNIGSNLRWIAQHVPATGVWGLDINEKALEQLRREVPQINTVWGSARQLPFRDNFFDMVFTMGVLIHQPPEALPIVMSEIVRCARQYVLCAEYYSEVPTEVAYRGQSGALFKRDFGRFYADLFPQLKLRNKTFLGKDAGWDDITFWLFEKV